MIVLDASSLLEFLLNTATERQVGVRIVDPDVILHVPHLADIEVAQSLHRQVRSGAITATEGGEVLTTLQRMDMVRHAHQPLLPLVWRMRENLTAYDAVYVALAEVLDATLLTCDARLARAPGLRARVIDWRGTPSGFAARPA
ncbi:MAG TPA: type II toxin-antitoxin system VapC family toxin [Terriglobales bacterium]|nr:type II toxin-antitoxin system VapC family toxin [Terriglobales bacterium]